MANSSAKFLSGAIIEEGTMPNMPRLSYSGIEYLTHVWNFFTGCHHKQSGTCPPEFTCWAETITKRFKGHYPNGFYPTFYPEAFLSPIYLKKPARIGCAFMGDLFGDWVDPGDDFGGTLGEDDAGFFTLKGRIEDTIKRCPQHTFVFLTKNPKGLLPWSPFPDNAWVGTTVCNREMAHTAFNYLQYIDAKHKWLSFEPLLDDVSQYLYFPGLIKMVDWVVVGSQSSPRKYPDVDWVENIVWACLKAHVPVWLKNNLVKALPPAPPFYVPPCELPTKGSFEMVYRQEIPKRYLPKDHRQAPR